MEKRHRVLIAEDQHLLRSGLCRMVSELCDYSIVGEASDGLEACRLAIATMPDLILMDLSMPGGSGFEAIAAIKRRAPQIRIIVLTVHRSEEHVRESFAAGADGYVIKDASFEDLVGEMRLVMQGKRNTSLDACGRRAGSLNHAPDTPQQTHLWDTLTGRERSVLRLVVEGHTNRQVGEHLKLSPKTIEKHRANLMRKLGITNVTGLVRIAIDMGVLTLPHEERVHKPSV
ncbi:response regulator [Paraburkholderia caffeinilytica]|uniref:DNA-binding response regulator n=1 Tax=Paraburkholderia caffeinilytica TaxID=1761016 RepID=A0ABQ1N6W1_9BURK|nr:response regulator transcription factor [Paraburkholderia caffeinilytica]GGC56432.1 DNA-binding response regulator [Paraburkholderia caffeinilytica]CAB3809655.1 Oxygen regulatory protein NreC [Paraburkholderia caffeinilytica]